MPDHTSYEAWEQEACCSKCETGGWKNNAMSLAAVRGIFLISRLSRFVEPGLGRVARSLHGLGLKPNHVTLMSFCLSIGAALSFVLVAGHTLKGISAGILLLLSGLLDATDGAMARLYGEESHFGAFLDSVLDRISEIVVYWGIVYAGLVNLSIGLAALSGSLMVSYARARAEQLGSEMKGVGIAERPERLLILAVAALLDQLSAGVVLIALLSAITVLQRIKHARSTMVNAHHHSKEQEGSPPT
jgi:archaetidylinositol phosphate synthase